MGTYARILSRVSLDTSQYNKELAEMQRKTRAAISKMKSIGSDLTQSFTLPTGFAAGASLNAYAEYESLTKALSTQEATVKSLNARLEELRQVAKAPGIGFQEAIQGDVRLRAVGIAAGQSAKILKEFANAIAQTGGGKAELNSVTVQLGQMAAKGKVFAQDLKPIIEAAPVVGKALSNMFGTVDSESIQATLSKAGKNSKEFINDLLKELQKMPRVSGGFKNALENMKDGLFQFGASIGQSIDKTFNLTDRLNAMSDKIIDVGRQFGNLPEPLQKFIVGTTSAAAATGPLLFGLGKVSELFTSGGSFSKGVTLLRTFGKSIWQARKAVASKLALLYVAYEVIKGLVNVSGGWKKEFEELYKVSVPFRAVLDGVLVVANGIWQAFKLALGAITDLLGIAGGLLVQVFRDLKNIVIDIFGGDVDYGKDRMKEMESSFISLKVRASDAWDAIRGKVTSGDIKEGTETLQKSIAGLNTALSENKKVSEALAPTKRAFIKADGDGSKVVDKYKEIVTSLSRELATVALRQMTFGDAFDSTKFQINAVEKAINDLIELGTKKALAKIPELTEKLKQLKEQGKIEEITGIFKDLTTEMAKINTISFNIEEKLTGEIGALKKTFEGLYDVNALDTDIADRIKSQITEAQISLDRVELKIKGVTIPDTWKTWDERAKKVLGVDFAHHLNTARNNIEEFGTAVVSKWDEIGKKIGETFEKISGIVTPIFDGIMTFIGQGIENRKANLDNYYDAEKQRIEQSQLTEEQKAAAITALEETVAKKKRKIARDEAKAAKARAIFEATINAGAAIVKALTAGPIAGPILAAAIGALAAANIAAIASTPLQALAKGGLAYGPTTAIVGDNRNASSDPEVIAPLSKLESYMGGSRYVPEVTIRNGDIKIVSDYNVQLDKRLRGAA